MVSAGKTSKGAYGIRHPVSLLGRDEGDVAPGGRRRAGLRGRPVRREAGAGTADKESILTKYHSFFGGHNSADRGQLARFYQR